MTPRPFYRWKSFWLGLCVLVFLAWAWWDSARHETGFQVQIISGSGGMLRLDGETFVFWEKTFRPPASYWRNTPDCSGDEWTVFFEDESVKYSRIPDSLVLVPFLALWLAWLFWHWKREQKK